MHLFAGAGGGLLADLMLGHQPVCAVEINLYCQQVLAARQKDGNLPWFPIFDDVQTFDGYPWRGLIDIIAGGFPCQDISAAGRGAGIDGERSGMWVEMARIIGEVRPRFVFVENSPMLTSRGLGRVLGDLATLGFDAEWGVLGAADVGAPHQRDRIWIVGNSNDYGQAAAKVESSTTQGGDSCKTRQEQTGKPSGSDKQHEDLAYTESNGWQGRNISTCSPEGERPGLLPELAGSGGGVSADVAYTGGNRLQGCGQGRTTTGPSGLCSGAGWHEVEQLPSAAAEWWQSEPDVGRVANELALKLDKF